MNGNYKKYLQFTRKEWCYFLQETPFAFIAEGNLKELYGQTETVVSSEEIKEIYLPLSRLLSTCVTTQRTIQFLNDVGESKSKAPYTIGISGSVVVGKSTTSRVLKTLLSRYPDHPSVEIITTDGFLYPNAELTRQGLMSKKGFPESYDMLHFLQILNSIKSGKRKVLIPIYSHLYYDVVPNKYAIIDRPDIIIFEGLNLLQIFTRKSDHSSECFVSDFFDFFLVVDAKIEIIKNWYIDRILNFWRGPFKSPNAYFHCLTSYSKKEVVRFAEKIWKETNEANFFKNILPFKYHAQLILEKTDDHSVQKIYLKNLL
ncbi:type I pantothenate kinase [Coxiella endosymbiont of Amblyomma sculptum]|uniref:type I pantothenate kinase n=1 Tax=Coxiella endosymbiont of Amblyomma sculptum TaxID=2487929 RepID=UPI00132EB87E|nr:type I pantothenate kinase [Coxiella endosymbiont of Amblyomma sculptum]QHG92423.1 type I pantothenate kinase [Coxiella endosymbiont of Amblyomma sculptum]